MPDWFSAPWTPDTRTSRNPWSAERRFLGSIRPFRRSADFETSGRSCKSGCQRWGCAGPASLSRTPEKQTGKIKEFRSCPPAPAPPPAAGSRSLFNFDMDNLQVLPPPRPLIRTSFRDGNIRFQPKTSSELRSWKMQSRQILKVGKEKVGKREAHTALV